MKPSILIRLYLAAGCAMLSGSLSLAQPSLDSIYPDNAFQFQPTNKLAFTIGSGGGVAVGNITVQLAVTNLDRTGSSVLLTSTNGLTITGTANSRVVTASITTNKVYTAIIQATDASGVLMSTNKFDTITPSYTWEAEDYDYEGGKFIDNPQTNAYAGLVATRNVDAFNPVGGSSAYNRPVDTAANGDLGTETCSDTPRVQYSAETGFTDYDQGWNDGGSGLWGNFTRHYPAGKWNIFIRAAGWANSTESCDLFLGGPNGSLLGRFVVPNTSTTDNQYQNYTLAPLVDVAGNLIEWDPDGSAQTLTLKTVQGSYNANFFMLMPVDPNYKPKPFVSNVSPDATKQMFSYTNRFYFTVNSVPGLTSNDVVVTLNGVTPSGLAVSGSSRVMNFSCPLATNVAYSVSINVKDANGSSSYSTAFGTFATNNYIFEAEDFDYDNGKYFDNPQLNFYAGLTGVDGVDAHNTSTGVGTAYRAADTGNLGNETCGDVKRPQYTAAGTNDYDIGWTATGNWANYTRTYPAGAYSVMMRGASPNGQRDGASLLRVTSGVGTPDQTTTSLGTFNFPLTGGWQTYTWTPLVDSAGNQVVITNSGAVSTLRLNEDNGGWNGNCLMLVPPNKTRPVLSHISPDGLAMFTPTNTLSFVASSAVGVDSKSVVVTLNGTPASNLVFGGSPTNLTVSFGNLQPETAYSAKLTVNTTNNDPYVLNYTFDTFTSTHYTVEAEDYDYGGGKYIDNPPVDAYAGLAGVDGVDAHNTSTGVGAAYRAESTGDLGNEIAYDLARAAFAGTNDYDIGWTAAGNWGNYTRTYPKGSFNVYLRGSSPSGQASGADFSRVTSGAGTPNQATNWLGTFNFPATGGYQSYTWVPLVDSTGKAVVVTNSGSVSTYRLSQNSGGWNANFFMFVPLAATGPQLTAKLSADKITISFATQSGASYQVEYKAKLSDASWTALGSPIVGNGSVQSVQDPTSQSTRFYHVKVTGM